MKKSFFITIIVACLFAACNRPEPELSVNPNTSLDVMIKYFPYDINEHFVFEHEKTGEKQELSAYNYDNRYGETYPLIQKEGVNNIDSSKSYGDWCVCIIAPMIAEDNNPAQLEYTPGSIKFFVSGSKFEPNCHVQQAVILQFNKTEYFYGNTFLKIDTAQFFSFFTDTLTISLTKRTLTSSWPSTEEQLPEGACVHIVKNIGITDFTTDGETYWRRVAK